MTRVATADDDSSFVMTVGRDGSRELRGVDKTGAGKAVEALEVGGKVRFTRVASRLDDVLFMLECSR